MCIRDSYEGDEYQRGNLRRAVGTNIETRFNSDVGRETDAHQGDVVLDEIHDSSGLGQIL